MISFTVNKQNIQLLTEQTVVINLLINNYFNWLLKSVIIINRMHLLFQETDSICDSGYSFNSLAVQYRL